MERNILWASRGELPAGWPLMGHTHPYYHLFFILKGKAVFLLDHRPYAVSAGDCLVVPPNVWHEVCAEEHTLLDSYEIKFTLSPPLQQMAQEAGVLVRRAPDYVGKSVQYIVYNWARRDLISFSHMDHILHAMVMSLYLEPRMAGEQVSSFVETEDYSPLVQRIIAYVERNFAEPFSLDELSAALEYSKKYLCTVFKQDTGLTILAYLNHVRIRQATFQLYYHDVPIGVIGRHVGFTTAIHFDRTFKKLVGLSPSRYKACYSIAHGDEQARLPRLYEELLGVKILPLAQSVENLRRLGRSVPDETPSAAAENP